MAKYKGGKGLLPYLVDPSDKWCVLEALSGIILRYNPGPVVEVGCTYGDSMYHRRKSTNILSEKTMAARVPFYTCDIKFNVEIDYDLHQHFIGKSVDFIKGFSETNLSLVFLDGCHDYEVVKKEFYFFYARLRNWGVIFMHDTHPKREALLARGSCSDSYKVRQEIEAKRDALDCDVFTWPHIIAGGGAGLTMVMKKDPGRDYFQK